jgi:hypothetical protein
LTTAVSIVRDTRSQRERHTIEQIPVLVERQAAPRRRRKIAA